ncbi:vWA domain-containing protein [Actinomadura macrotermitis]|uniref:VWFA domain-containing protein n=1 Tax=Actinomadura macrotermitis TaxID=2585200 RepID=A0A7K0C7I6_9ACTN|nr:vWA domain-containing protein [Actinomadura macrotermitis]MQY09431.1 hypothetical protein [Actinomadura macrotermitis]
MSAPGSSGEQQSPPPGEVWLRRLMQVLILDVCSSVVIGLALTVFRGTLWLNVAGALVVLAALTGALFYFQPELARRLLERAVAALRWAGSAAVWTLLGAAAMTAVLLAVLGVLGLRDAGRPCGQPLGLRVLTGPEMLTPLRDAAAAFVDGRRRHGCRRYTVDVVPEAGPVPVYDGFTGLWKRGESADSRRLYGPQPDVWVPAAGSEYDFVPKSRNQAAPGGDLRFVRGPSLGTSPMVLALFPRAHRNVTDTNAPLLAPSIKELLDRIARDAGRRRGIARPVPETSTPALLATPALYDADPATPPAADERAASPGDLVAPDAVSLLCRFREQAARGLDPPEDVTVLVPEQALYDYDMGRPLGDRCGPASPDSFVSAKWRLYPYYAPGLPTLDHPFVQVKWRGQDTAARDAAVRDLRDWLVRHPLTAQGLRDDHGEFPLQDDSGEQRLAGLQRLVGEHVLPYQVKLATPIDVQGALDRISEARPKVSVSLLLDLSGSMGGSAEGGGSRLARGTSFLQSLVAQLQANDRIELRTFSSAAPPHDRAAFGNVPDDSARPDQKALVTGRLQALTSGGSDRSLADAIEDADPPAGRRHLVLLTDGQVPATNPDLDERAARLAGAFRNKHPDLRLTVVVAGPAGCGAGPARRIAAALARRGERSCVALTGAPEQEQAAQLLAGLRGGR